MESTTTAGGSAAGDGGDDADGIAVFGGRGFFGEVADVFVVDVDIDEAAQFGVFGGEVVFQVTEMRCESAQCFAYGVRGDFSGVTLAGVNPERGWDHYFHCHLFRSNRSWNS